LQIAPKSRGFTVVLGLFAALPALSIDVSAPTLPLLPDALGTSRAVAGLTLSLFMVGFAVGQLGGGTLSDGQGRRPALLSGLAGFTVAGLSCALALSGGVLAFSRLVQGFCAGVCSVVAFAMVQDLFEGDTARAKRSYVTMIFTAVPILAPALGSVLTDRFGWRSVHGILAVGGVLLFIVTWFGVAESRFPGLDTAAPIADRAIGRIWGDGSFVCITLANALSYGCIFAYIAGAPVIIIGQMGLPSTVFAGVFACTAIALAAGAWTSGQLSRRGTAAAVLLDVSLVVAAGAAIALAVASLSGIVAGAIVMPLLMVVLFTRGLIAPNMQHLAIERQRERAGVASAAVGVSQLLAGAAASAVVAVLLPMLGTGAVAYPMAVLATAALLPWCWNRRR
jgi:DHA1 family bicyclomycin/chloramphenicol resistance-like MFS transporter